MDYPNHTTEHQKFKHLSYDELVVIQIRLKDGWSSYRIAREKLNCAPNTVRNALRKGLTPLYHGKVVRYKAKTAWKNYCSKHHLRMQGGKRFREKQKRHKAA